MSEHYGNLIVDGLIGIGEVASGGYLFPTTIGSSGDALMVSVDIFGRKYLEFSPLASTINSISGNVQAQLDSKANISDLNNYTLLSTTTSISGDLQIQIDAITVPTSATFLVDYDMRYVNESDLTVTLSDYTLLTTTANISGNLQSQIDALVIPDVSNYTLLSTTASISGGLNDRLVTVENNYATKTTPTSGTYNNVMVNSEGVVTSGGNLSYALTSSIPTSATFLADYDARYVNESDITTILNNYTLLSTTASISGNLQSQIDALSSGVVTSIEGLTGVVDISGGSGINISTNVNSIVIENAIKYVSVPSSPTDTGTQGQRAYSSNYVYECIATNTWVRYAVATSW